MIKIIIKKLKLGIVYKNGKVINHRSFLKVFTNPFLRHFGICIATHFLNNIDGKPTIILCEKSKEWIFIDKYDIDYDYIIKKRILI